MIKVKNLPAECLNAPTVSVKPKVLLFALLIIGLIILFFYPYYIVIGLCFSAIAAFCLVALPDHDLVKFTENYIVLFNQRDRSMCMMIYWDEIVNWQYEWHGANDLLVISLVDGSTQTIEMFSKSSIAAYMNQYAPGKEIKTTRRKEGIQ